MTLPHPCLGQIISGDTLWPSTVVAVTLVALVTIVMAITIAKHGADSGLKMWGGLGTLVGFLIGTVGTFFFTRQTTAVAMQQAATATVLVEKATQQVQQKEEEITQQAQQIDVLQKDVIRKADELKRLSTQNPALGVNPEVLSIPRFDLGRLRGAQPGG